MQFEYKGLSGINGPLVVIEGVRGIGYEEICEIRLDDGSKKIGRVIELVGDKAIVQVFEGTIGLSLNNTRTKFEGKPMEIGLSKEIIGRVFNGSGEPIDGLGPIFAEKDKSRLQTVPEKLYSYGYFQYRRTYDAYPRTETSRIFGIGYVS